MFRTSVLVALLSFGSLAGCGDSNNAVDNWNELDQELGGVETNGCAGTSSAYTDLRGQATVTITAGDNAWVDPHNACIGVSPGTAVTWQGNFDTHPLVGGVSPQTDSASPITQANASGTDDVTITFNATAITVYPYFCDVHKTTMGGVIAVVP
jgi:plastocyanin